MFWKNLRVSRKIENCLKKKMLKVDKGQTMSKQSVKLKEYLKAQDIWIESKKSRKSEWFRKELENIPKYMKIEICMCSIRKVWYTWPPRSWSRTKILNFIASLVVWAIFMNGKSATLNMKEIFLSASMRI